MKHQKKLAKLERRRKDYDEMIAKSSSKSMGGYKRPGSVKK